MGALGERDAGPMGVANTGDDGCTRVARQAQRRLAQRGSRRAHQHGVAAPQGLPFEITRSLTPARMRDAVQVIIRDAARAAARDYFVIEGARNWTVGDQHTKKELILRGMGWGHIPLHMVDKELRSGKLVSLEGRHFKRSRLDIVVARRANCQPGPVARALWDALAGAT